MLGDDAQIPIIEEDYEPKKHRHFVLDGILTLPEQEEEPKKGIVVFAHGSGSIGRHSPRNQYVASVLNNSGIGTLLVDLLTEEEKKIDEKTREYRFNIKLLANRLVAITDWLLTTKNPTKTQRGNLSIGYFGSSTGAAAALMAAASAVEHPAGDDGDVVKAIVSRGGRPDLANSSYLKKVQAATLFLVGSKDNPQVIALNQKALQQLKNAKEKRLVMIPGAGHLFEEPGTLEEAAQHAASWFERYLF
jgi:putative phosphoribosyl transferase